MNDDTTTAAPFGFGTILVATDGSADATLACSTAADLARRSGADLHIVHAWQLPSSGYLYPVTASATEEYLAGLEQVGRDLLAADRGRAEDAGAHVAATHLRESRAADAILSVAADVDAGLVVMGSRGLGSIRRLVMGSVSTEVAHRGHRPLLVMRGDEVWPPHHIVLGYDGSPEARAAAMLGGRLASLLRASVDTVGVIPHVPDSVVDAPGMSVETALAAAQSTLEDTVSELTGFTPGAARVIVGEPVTALLDTVRAEGPATLLVLGSRHLTGAQRMVLGSISTRLLHLSPVPVLVVPSRGAATTLGRHAAA